MQNFWISILEQGLIFGIMVLGVYISYKILDFPDLSVDGSFPLGAAVAAQSLISGQSPLVSTVLALVAGLLGGTLTGILHVRLKISNLLSGILVMIGLYSINLRIMGKSNIPLFTVDTIFSNPLPALVTIALLALASKLFLDFFLKTKVGYLLKATGDNPQLVTSLGRDIGAMKILGLAISNGLVALSGAIMAQHQGFADVGMGTGIIVMGLASIIMGEALFKKATFLAITTVALIGAILYKGAMAFALELRFPPTDLKLITAVIVVIALSLNKGVIPLRFGGKKAVPAPEQQDPEEEGGDE